jgi:hypothetical protein
MKKLVSFLAVFVSLLCVFSMNSGIVLGCVGPAYEDHVSFLEFSLAGDPLFRAYHYYKISPPLGPLKVKSTTKRENYDNLMEWQQFVKTGASMDEIAKVIYGDKNQGIFNYALNCLKNGIPADSKKMGELAGNRWLEGIIKTKQAEILEYIIYAKDCEPWVAAWNPWEDAPERDLQAMQRLIDLGRARYAKSKADFIKLRYAYQVVRLAQYSGQPEKCIAYFDQMVPGLQVKSIITYWAMGHKAGALRATGKLVESLVLFSLIFDQCPNMMDSAFRDFYIPDETLWLQCLNSAGNSHRQATLWMLRGLREKRLTLEPLQHMFDLEPKSPRLEVMLIREVNRAEREYLTSAVFFPGGPKSPAKTDEYLAKFRTFAGSCADGGRVRQPGLWYLAAGYLSLMMGDFAQATPLIAKAEAVQSNSGDLQQQIALVKNLIAIAASSSFTAQIETDSYLNLVWAGGLVHDYNNQAIYRSLLVLLGQKYLAAGDIPKAAGCFYKTSVYAHSANFLVDIYSQNEDLERMSRLIQKKAGNKLEGLLTQSLPFSVPEIHYIQATKLMRREKFSEALAFYKQIPAAFWNQYKNPSSLLEEGFFNDPREYTGGLWTNFEREAFDLSEAYGTHEAILQHKVRFYTKLDFAAKIAALQESARANPKNAANDYWQMANGFFHSPFWGYNDPVWKGGLIGSLNYYPDYPFNVLDFAAQYKAKAEEFFKEYGTRRVALQYYRKTISAAKDRELAAKSAALAHLCQYGFTSYNEAEETKPDWSFFGLLKKNYTATQIYRHLVEECATLREFLGN